MLSPSARGVVIHSLASKSTFMGASRLLRSNEMPLYQAPYSSKRKQEAKAGTGGPTGDQQRE